MSVINDFAPAERNRLREVKKMLVSRKGEGLNLVSVARKLRILFTTPLHMLL